MKMFEFIQRFFAIILMKLMPKIIVNNFRKQIRKYRETTTGDILQKHFEYGSKHNYFLSSYNSILFYSRDTKRKFNLLYLKLIY